MIALRFVIVLLMPGAALTATGPARSAPPGVRDPDWPCEQVKVPELSLAAVWSGTVPDDQTADWRKDPQTADLVQVMAQRRVPIEEAQTRIRAFAAQTGDQKQPKLLSALGGVFSVLNEERSSVVAGLDRFGARQKELATSIRDDNEKLRALRSDQTATAAEVNQMVQQITWEAQVFQDRRQALRYACDVPGKIEQRLFAVARAVEDALH
jgi:hypothetical protein